MRAEGCQQTHIGVLCIDSSNQIDEMVLLSSSLGMRKALASTLPWWILRRVMFMIQMHFLRWKCPDGGFGVYHGVRRRCGWRVPRASCGIGVSVSLTACGCAVIDLALRPACSCWVHSGAAPFSAPTCKICCSTVLGHE